MTPANTNSTTPAPDSNGGGRSRALPHLVGLFEGYGGLTDGVALALGGAHLAAVAEVEPAMCRLLAFHRPTVPNLGDVTSIDWQAWPHRVDVIAGGFPCQDVSLAGLGKGMRAGTRSGLWSEFARAIADTRPRLVVAENVRGLLSAAAGDPAEVDDGSDDELDAVTAPPGVTLRALGAVLGDLAALGYDAEWVGVRASDIGAPHQRFRVFVLAFPTEQREPVPADGVRLAVWSPARGVWELPHGQVDLFADDVDAFVDTWPANGCTRSGVAYRRPDVVPGSAAVMFPTPLTSDMYNPTHDELRGARADRAPQVRAIAGLLGTPTGWQQGGDAATDPRELLPLQVQRMAGPSLPTPVTTDAAAGRRRNANGEPLGASGHERDSLTDAVVMLPTPEATNSNGGRRIRDDGTTYGERANPTLVDAVAFLPTPKASDGEFGTPTTTGRDHAHATHLATRVRYDVPAGGDPALLPTPDAFAGERGAGQHPDVRRAGGHSVVLGDVVEHLLPTVTTSDTNGAGPHGDGGLDLRTTVQAHLLPTVVAHDSGNSPEAHLRKKPGRQVVTSLQVMTEHDLLTRGGNPTAEPQPGSPWGKYAPAVHRWEHLTRPAPAPTVPNRNGNPQLSPLFTEWMMGLPAGLVTDPTLGLTRPEQLKACGNGVVPQQAAHAVRLMLDRLTRDPLAD